MSHKALYSMSAERALIGSVLMDTTVLDAEAADITADDFYAQAHRAVWAAIKQLQAERQPVDIVTLFEALGIEGVERIGGMDVLSGFTSATPSAANAAGYVAVVKRWSALRRISAGCRDTIASIETDPGVDPTAVVLGLTKKMDAISGSFVSKRCARVGDRLKGWYERFLAKADGEEEPGVSCGFPDLDERLGRLGADRLIILAARPAMGKTSLAQQIATNVSRSAGAVYFASLEMSTEDLIDRQMAQETRIGVQDVARGRMRPDQMTRIIQAAKSIKDLPLYYDDDPDATISAVCARARAQHRQVEGGLKLVVVDYLQLLGADPGHSSEDFDVISAASRRLKLLAKELSCPVLCLAQLNRKLESRQDKRPTLADLRGSGRIEEDADQVLFVYRDEYYNADSDQQGLASVITGKNRHGGTGEVTLRFRAPCVRFESLAKEDDR